jgi:hypothetical protein
MYSNAIWMCYADVVWSYADEVSIFEMLLMDCKGDSMLSIRSQIGISHYELSGEKYLA